MDLPCAWTDRRVRAALLGCAVVVPALVGGTIATRGPSTPVAAAIPPVAAPAQATTLLVFVSGAVVHPGLYELAAGARTSDAVSAAGGLLATADAGRLPDLAAVLHDGHQVNVPFATAGTRKVAVKVDVNTATVVELEAIPGLTPSLAQAIVDARTQWGDFASLGDLRGALQLDSATAALIGRHLTFSVP